MSKTDDALDIIRAFGLPKQQQNERSALTLLALADIRPRGKWKNTRQPLLRILDIMDFMRKKYGKDYAANSRETIRRQTVHQFEQARIVDRNPDDPARPTNSGKTVYALTDDAATVLKVYGTRRFEHELDAFVEKFGELKETYTRKRKLRQVTLHLPDGAEVGLSPGTHNELQVAVIEKFGPHFAPGAEVLYVGDTAKKHVICAAEPLSRLLIEISEHDKLPDVILYDSKKNWLFLIEAVTSHGPVNPKRHAEIESMLSSCPAERIYVTAFLDRGAFRRYAADIAWETEVWIAQSPGHMIHFNGPKFLGPFVVER